MFGDMRSGVGWYGWNGVTEESLALFGRRKVQWQVQGEPAEQEKGEMWRSTNVTVLPVVELVSAARQKISPGSQTQIKVVVA